MDVIAGAVLILRADPAVRAAVGTDASGNPLIVQDTAPLLTEFTQRVCVVVSHAGPAAASDLTDFDQVRVQVEFWCDPIRDANGDPADPPSAGRQRMVTAYQAVDRRLHRPQGGGQWWAGVYTVDATRLAGLTPYLVPATDGLWRGTAFYAIGIA
jgi:hypothetical protein